LQASLALAKRLQNEENSKPHNLLNELKNSANRRNGSGRSSNLPPPKRRNSPGGTNRGPSFSPSFHDLARYFGGLTEDDSFRDFQKKTPRKYFKRRAVLITDLDKNIEASHHNEFADVLSFLPRFEIECSRENARTKDIKEMLYSLRDESKSGDRLVAVICGHGSKMDSCGHSIINFGKEGHGQALRRGSDARYITSEWLSKYVASIPEGRTLFVILSCCYSGVKLNVWDVEGRKTKGGKVVVITSDDGTQTSTAHTLIRNIKPVLSSLGTAGCDITLDGFIQGVNTHSSPKMFKSSNVGSGAKVSDFIDIEPLCGGIQGWQ